MNPGDEVEVDELGRPLVDLGELFALESQGEAGRSLVAFTGEAGAQLAQARSERRAARDESRRRNEEARQAIAARLPTAGYQSADRFGRIAQEPEAGRRYLRWTRGCLAHLATHPDATVTLSWKGEPLSEAHQPAVVPC